MDSIAVRTCWKCKESKVLSEYYRDCTDRLGYQKCCKTCTKAHNNKFNARRPEYSAQYSKKRYKELRKDPDFNTARYQKYRTEYLRRRDTAIRSVRGRLYSVFASARGRARARGSAFEITLDWVLQQYEQQKGSCALTGIPFVLDRNPDGKRFYTPFAPSLDQVVPGAGYTAANTRLVCVAMNVALNRFGEDVFAKIAAGFLVKRGGYTK